MRRVIKRYLWVAQLVGVLLVGLLVSIGVSSIVSAIVAQVTPYGGGGGGASSDEGGASAPPSRTVADSRNIFNQSYYEDSEEPPVDGEATDGEATDGEATDGEDLVEETPEPVRLPGQPVPTDLRVLLSGTQVASNPRWSMAILRAFPEGDSEEQTLYARVGDVLLDDAQIYEIDNEAVYFYRRSKDNQPEYIDFSAKKSDIIARAAEAPAPAPEPAAETDEGEEPQVGRNDAAQEPARPARPSSASGRAAFDPSSIERVGDGTYAVPNEMAQAVRDNPRLLRDASVAGPPPKLTPYYQNGEISGFRIRSLTPGSLYTNLGLQNGDTILTVNGQVVNKPQQAMALFDQLGPDGGVEVRIRRRGRIETLNYQLK